MRLLIMIAALTFTSGLAQAGDWSGSNVGVQSGAVNPASGHKPDTGDGSAHYGVHGGTGTIFGRLVLGAEVGYRRFDPRSTAPRTQIDDVGRLEFCAGRDFGRQFDPDPVYAIVRGETGQAPETGVIYGLDLSTAADNHLHHSDEALRVVFDGFASGVTDLQSDSYSVRVSFRF